MLMTMDTGGVQLREYRFALDPTRSAQCPATPCWRGPVCLQQPRPGRKAPSGPPPPVRGRRDVRARRRLRQPDPWWRYVVGRHSDGIAEGCLTDLIQWIPLIGFDEPIGNQ
jgi:hypothetical protein